MTLEAIKEAIIELPAADKSALASWLKFQDAESWKREIESDFSDAGAGASLLNGWDAEIESEVSILLEEFLAQRENVSGQR